MLQTFISAVPPAGRRRSQRAARHRQRSHPQQQPAVPELRPSVASRPPPCPGPLNCRERCAPCDSARPFVFSAFSPRQFPWEPFAIVLPPPPYARFPQTLSGPAMQRLQTFLLPHACVPLSTNNIQVAPLRASRPSPRMSLLSSSASTRVRAPRAPITRSHTWSFPYLAPTNALPQHPSYLAHPFSPWHLTRMSTASEFLRRFVAFCP